MVAEHQTLLSRFMTPAFPGVGGCDRIGKQEKMWRQITHRIGIGGIAGKEVRLAAAAPEIARFLRATAARLLHPLVAAEAIESLRVIPDRSHRLRAHIRKCETRQHARGMAG